MFGKSLLDYLGDLSPLLPKHPFLDRGVMIPDRAQCEDGEMEA